MTSEITQKIMEPIPEAVKVHLPKPLKPEKIPPPQKLKKPKEAKKSKAILDEFDPVPKQKNQNSSRLSKRKITTVEKQFDRLEFHQTP